MYFRLAKTAVTAFAGVAALCLASAPAALAAPAAPADGGGTYFVPCSGYALYEAVNNADNGDTLVLAPGCTYYLRDGLGTMRTITIVGHSSTITRARGAGSFTLLTVEDCESANVTLINVNFTNGGGDVTDGGAIYNYNRLTVAGGTFSGNEAEYGGAIYNDDDMRVTGATFTHNIANEGGAVYNDDDATIGGSSFTWNSTVDDDPYGGAIFNEDVLYLSNTGFLANSSSYGGAIDNEYHLYAKHITVTANAATVDGGGIYNDDETAVVTSSAVFGNMPNNCHDVPGCFF
jgi:predicted outer membrane repeat protein